MGRSLDSLQFADATATHTNVTADSSAAIPKIDAINSIEPKLLYLQAIRSNTTGDAVDGDWVSVSLGVAAANGSPTTGLALVVGQPGIVVNSHGFGFLKFGFPGTANTGTAIEVVAVPLQNF